MNKTYISPEIEIIKFRSEDIIVASGASVDPVSSGGSLTGNNGNSGINEPSSPFNDLFGSGAGQ